MTRARAGAQRRRRGTAARLAAAVRARRASARALCEEALRRIEAAADLNAVVATRAGDALREAEALDARIAAGEPIDLPLAGIPVLVKDMEDVAGMPTTHGSRLCADDPPAVADSLIPSRLRAAGAIIVGKSNLPEFATEGYTANLLFGATRNPWGLDWSPGGSSGGSAAAMAAGLVPFGSASDGGGSIRIPAAFCGLLGIKPTLGVIGRFPPHDWIDLSTWGPMATGTADLRLLLEVERGPVPGDPSAVPLPALIEAPPPTRLLAAHRTSDLGPLPRSLAALFESAVGALADVLRLPVWWLEPCEVFDTGDPDHDWFLLATAEHVAALGRERVITGLPRMHPAARCFLELGLGISIDTYLAARRRRFDHVRRLDLLLGAADLLVTPTVPVEGWRPDGEIPAELAPDGVGVPAAAMLPAWAYSTAVQNVTGHPAISLPAGRSGNGIPFGLQVTAPRFLDGLLLNVAARWEEAHPWPPVAPGHAQFGEEWT
jgi:Asp-tRNA(Asn)/Glu-tRNA(Gln) amidotransferase A subunit family amidase